MVRKFHIPTKVLHQILYITKLLFVQLLNKFDHSLTLFDNVHFASSQNRHHLSSGYLLKGLYALIERINYATSIPI